MLSKSKKTGFTLIELLVTVAIISTLSSIVYASLSSARAKSASIADIDLLKQIEKGLNIYQTNTGPLPSPLDYNENDPSWAGCIVDSSLLDGDGDGSFFVDFLEGKGLQGKPAPPNSAIKFYYIKGNQCGCVLSGTPTYMLIAYGLKKPIPGLTDNDAGENSSIISPSCGLAGPNNYVILGF